MTQGLLPLDVQPEPSLPYSGTTAISRACSREAAIAVAATRESKTTRYLAWLRQHGPASDHQAADALRLPLSSICSIRNGVNDRAAREGQLHPIAPVRKAPGPYGTPVTLWEIRG